MIVEIIGGFVANSLALLSDGFHMLSDTISLGVALVAFIYAEKNATQTKHMDINVLKYWLLYSMV